MNNPAPKPKPTSGGAFLALKAERKTRRETERELTRTRAMLARRDQTIQALRMQLKERGI